MILNELAKKNAEWHKMALHICKDKNLADELVQEMYLKLFDLKKEVTDGYIFMTLRSLYYDSIQKSKKEILIDDFSYFNIEQIEYLEIERPEYKDLINDLTWYERTTFELSTLYGQRELSRQTGIHLQTIHRVNKLVRLKLKNK
jgi:DNA-directed RNA polymerase specialized sigma24 family protein